jgi:hypothetical protein
MVSSLFESWLSASQNGAPADSVCDGKTFACARSHDKHTHASAPFTAEQAAQYM